MRKATLTFKNNLAVEKDPKGLFSSHTAGFSIGDVKMGAVIDLSGSRFTRLKVLERSPSRNHKAVWLCKCDCGKTNTVRSADLRSGKTQSCGCLGAEKRLLSSTKHGMKYSPFYNVWCEMKSRCLNPNSNDYKYYGGRGISVCKEWLRFENFLKDMYTSYLLHKRINEYTTIDRKDNDGSYEPRNCRWATRKEQSVSARQWGTAT